MLPCKQTNFNENDILCSMNMRSVKEKKISAIVRNFVFLLAFFMVTGVFSVLSTPEVYGATTAVDVEVGYFGGPYYKKATLTDSEIAAMGTECHTYTYVDSAPAVVYNPAEGVRFTTVLGAAGIDLGAVDSFSFRSVDSGGGFYDGRTYQKGNLLDQTRSYYPMLGDHFDPRTGTAGQYADDDAVQVPTMLVLKSDWKRYYEGMVKEDFSNLNEGRKISLSFGQLSPNEEGMGARASVQWIKSIVVQYSGYPTITTNLSSWENEVGGRQKLEAYVSTPDSFLTQSIASDLQWTSSDDSVVAVDQSGNVEILAEGNATVSVKYVMGNGSSYGVDVGVTGKGEEEQEEEQEEEPENGGIGAPGDGKQDSDGSSAGGGGKGHEVSSTIEAAGKLSAIVKDSIGSGDNIGLRRDGEMIPIEAPAQKSESEEGGRKAAGEEVAGTMSWRSFDLNNDAPISDEIPPIPENPLKGVGAATIGIFGVLGVIGRTAVFYAEMGGIKNVHRG